MKGCEDVRGDIQLVLAIGRKEGLFRAKIKHGEGRVGRRGYREILALRFGGHHLFLLTDEGQLFALCPRLVAGSVVLEPESKVEVFRGMLHVEQVFFQVFEANWRQVPTCEHILEADIEDGGDATRADLADSRGWITEAILETW